MWLTPKLDWTEEDYYNSEDLNRVESNTIEVAQLIQQLVGINVNLETTKTDRDYTTIEFADSLNRIERNIEKLSVLNLSGLKPLKTNWQVGDTFSYRDANRLENNLAILHPVLYKNITNVNYCGMVTCGEDVI
jgi:hypothetical protein